MAGQTGHQDIARRYAHAFFELAKEQGQVDAVSADLQALVKALAGSSDFRKFIDNAALRRNDQVKALSAVGEKAKFKPLTLQFLGTVAAKGRLNILSEIIAETQAEIARHKGEVTAHVTAAYELDLAQVASIAVSLKKILGLTVKVEMKEDASIMGGLIIHVGSQRIDSSVKAKLERLHRSLKSSNTSKNKTKMREVA